MTRPVMRATLGQLHDRNPDITIHLHCLRRYYVGEFEQHKYKRHHGRTLVVGEAIAEWGRDVTLDLLERRLVCTICGAKAPDARVDIGIPVGADAIAGRPVSG